MEPSVKKRLRVVLPYTGDQGNKGGGEQMFVEREGFSKSHSPGRKKKRLSSSQMWQKDHPEGIGGPVNISSYEVRLKITTRTWREKTQRNCSKA